mmetsp:Transcript_41559/g.60818  ORF Transcript_41559/g.60818 Transcript_41559/m.60818 type:complete len:652 (+) Transcript_41559:255-2210(+)
MAYTATLLPTSSVALYSQQNPPKTQAGAVVGQAPFFIPSNTTIQHAASAAMRLPTQQYPGGAVAGPTPTLSAGGLSNPGAPLPAGHPNPAAGMPTGLPGTLGVPPNMTAAAGMAMPGAVATSLPSVQGVAPAAGLGLVSPGDFAAHLNAAASGPTTHVLPTTNPYRDFSRIPMSEMVASPVDAGAVADTQSAGNLGTSSGKEPPFPVKLHRILSNPEFRDIITWLPHGRSWRVLKPKAFEERVIPLYFRHAKYASFMRQVNGWGFKRITQGPDHNSYYHELFLRGLPHLCLKMRRPNRAKQGAGDSDLNPDFYRISMVAPLPDNDDTETSALPGPPSPATNAASAAIAVSAIANAANVPNDAHTAGSLPVSPPASTPGAAPAPSGLTATEILQQHMQGKLQNPAASQSGKESSPSPKPGTAGGEDAGSVPSAVGENNLEAFRQRIKERSELVRQLKEVMDGAGSTGAAGATAASQQQFQQLQAGLPTQEPTVSATAVPQVMQSLGGIRPGGPTAAGPPFPGMGMLNQFGQFQNPLAGQAQYEQLFLNQQHQNLFAAAAAGHGGAVAMPQAPPSAPGTAPNLGNFGLMAMQNEALFAQMQAVQQQSQLQVAPQAPVAAPGVTAVQTPAAYMHYGGFSIGDDGSGKLPTNGAS